MPIVRSVEWLDQNTERNYPLTIEATRFDTTGAFRLPTDFIVGLRIAVHYGLDVEPGNFYLRNVSVFPTGFGITIGYDDGGSGVVVASTTIARAAFSEFGQYRLFGTGDYEDVDGYLVLGQLEGLDSQPAGDFTFTPASGRLETDCIVPMIKGISGVRVQNGSDISSRVVGDLVFRAGRNTRITVVEEAGEDPVITWDAIEGEGLNEECVCDDDDDTEPIGSINDVPPSRGRIVIYGSDCLQITPGENSLELNNRCSKPCCGRTELEQLTEALTLLQQQVSTYQIRMTNLEASTGQFTQLILGSKIGDACLDCD